jgi:protocatechuate 3,4-dioxygenase, alpha subunit
MSSFTYPVSSAPATAGVTPSQTVGPFFHAALPYDAGSAVVGSARAGAFTLHGHVYDGRGDPVPDALVEVWQADESGRFATQPGLFEDPGPEGFRGFGRSATDEAGHYAFTTIRPAGVPTTDGTPQAPHVAMSVFGRGMLRRVVTRVYFSLDGADPLLAAVEASRRATLLAVPDQAGYRFDVHLQGPHETVFLDVFGR